MRGALTGALERAYWWPHLSNGDWQREAKRYSDVARLSDELKNAIQSTHIASETHLPLAASSVSVGETILHQDLGDFEETLARLHQLSAGLALASCGECTGPAPATSPGICRGHPLRGEPTCQQADRRYGRRTGLADIADSMASGAGFPRSRSTVWNAAICSHWTAIKCAARSKAGRKQGRKIR